MLAHAAFRLSKRNSAMSAFAADVRPRSLSTGARPIKIEAICKKNRIRTNAVLRFAFAFLLKVSFERKAKRVFAQLFASKSWKSRQGRQTPGREGLFVILFVRRRSPKRFNWIVRGCCFCALLRGLQNLEAPRKENELSLFASCKK